jgi:hypothetical protein
MDFRTPTSLETVIEDLAWDKRLSDGDVLNRRIVKVDHSAGSYECAYLTHRAHVTRNTRPACNPDLTTEIPIAPFKKIWRPTDIALGVSGNIQLLAMLRTRLYWSDAQS